MKNSLLKLMALVVCALCVSSAKGAVAVWSYSSGTSTSVDTLNTGVSSASATLGTANGNTISVQTSGGAGVTGGYYKDTGNANKVNGNTLTITITAATGYTITLTSLAFNYNTFADASGDSVSSITWTYSTGTGNSSSTLGQSQNSWTSGQNTVSDTLNSITLNGGQTLTITGTFVNGGSGGTGDIGFDNITLNGTVVPEPVNYALAGFGLIVVGGTAGRRYLIRRRQQA